MNTAPDVMVAAAADVTADDVAGDPISREWTAFSEESKTLGIPRKDMPQVAVDDYDELYDWLGDNDVAVDKIHIAAGDLKPSQEEYSPKKVKEQEDAKPRTILVSSDDYVLDGHHYWMAQLEKDPEHELTVTRIGLPAREAIVLLNDFPKSFTRKGAAAAPKPKLRAAVRDSQMQEVPDSEVDFELPSANSFFGSHINLIPIQSAVQGPRLFYGARFYNQAMPLEKPEAAFVQNQIDGDPQGRSFDDYYGEFAGGIRADRPGKIDKAGRDAIDVSYDDGTKSRFSLYSNFPFNRKTVIHQAPTLQAGQRFTPGQLLARSNYTDDKGVLALGLNARVGLVPYKGHSIDDSIVISEGFAKRLRSEHSDVLQQEFDNSVRGGRGHYASLFPRRFKVDQLDRLDDDGVVKEGMEVQPGDPLILATKPRVLSSSAAELGRLSKAMRETRSDASTVWDADEPGIVTDVVKTRSGAKVVVRSYRPSKVGDKIVFRTGQKGIISKILPDDRTPRTSDGRPLDVLLNPLSIPSRVNSSLIYELLLGKVAEKTGKRYKLPGFTPPGGKWFDLVDNELKSAGLPEVETVWDPEQGSNLERPVTVGNGYILKLHHVGESKISARGQGNYDINLQPTRGSGDSARSKRLSGLENHGLLSAGAYATLREAATLRGQRNDDYWRQLREGYKPRAPGEPFVWSKFQALLNGSGLLARKLPGGVLRLGPMTDRDLDERQPVDIGNGDMVDLSTLEPVKGGLFDSSLVGANKWGRITLPHALPNPAMEPTIRKMLGLTEKELRAILAGEMELPEHLR